MARSPRRNGQAGHSTSTLLVATSSPSGLPRHPTEHEPSPPIRGRLRPSSCIRAVRRRGVSGRPRSWCGSWKEARSARRTRSCTRRRSTSSPRRAPPGTRSRCGIPSIPPRSAIRSVFRSSLRPPGRTSRTAGTSRRCGAASPARRAPASPDATAPLLFQALLGVPVSLLLRQHESEPRLEGGSRRIRPDSPGGRLRTSYSGMCRWDRLLAGRAAVRGAPTLGAAGEQGRTGT